MRSIGASTNLDKRQGVELVLASKLKTNSAGALAVVGCLGTSLDLRADFVEIAGSEDAQVVGSSDGGSVLGREVADRSSVLGNGGLVDVVTSLTTDDKTLVADDSVNGGSGALEGVDKSAEVEGGLLEEQVDLGGGVLGLGLEGSKTLELDVLGQSAVEFNLGINGVDGRPSDGSGDACIVMHDQQSRWSTMGHSMGLGRGRRRANSFRWSSRSL